MERIVLYPHPERDPGYTITRKAARILTDSGFACVTTESAPLSDFPVLPVETAFDGALAALSFGGDGTLLRCAKLSAPYAVPILGINLGHTGFLAHLSPDNLSQLNHIAHGRYTIRHRMMLDATLLQDDMVLSQESSVNDIVISRGMHVQTISLDIRADDQLIASFLGDGVIIASATGSTGYALSAGGPVIDPDLEALLITPICAHTSYAHSFVLSPNRTLHITATRDAHRETFLSIDGGPSIQLSPGQAVRVVPSRLAVRMLILEGHTFFDSVRTKIHRM